MGEGLGEVPFEAHVELLRSFLTHRDAIVERIAALLNAQRKPIHYLQDRALLSRQLGDCFFTSPEVTPEQARLRGQLEEAHWASGFRPRESPGLHNDVVDAAEMMVRGFHLWSQTRWPGRNGRVRYAQTLFDVHLIRCLMLLSMRLWDDESSSPAERLSQVQAVLDELRRSAPGDQPVLVRDARWLIPVAQSPTTDELSGYFEVAERIAATLSAEDRVEIDKAVVRLAGGHLRSQLRHYCVTKGMALDDDELVLRSRKSNALDFALLVQGLVPLLEAYERAVDGADERQRLDLADAICQAISPDPELFLNRVDLLGPYTMIEHLFVATDADRVVYTDMGRRHVRLLEEYAARIGRVSTALAHDCPPFRPIDGAYSPYGVIYGFSSNLIEHMALKTVQPDAVTRFGLEDVFAAGDAAKLAWVNGWRKLPHIAPEVAKQFDYPQRFAADVFERIERALRKRVADDRANATVRAGRLFVLPDGEPQADPTATPIPDLPVRFIGSSDKQLLAAHKAEPYDSTQLPHDRREGYFIVSYETSGGWVAITKDVLTEILGAGRDVKIANLPRAAAQVLQLMCPALAVLTDRVAVRS